MLFLTLFCHDTKTPSSPLASVGNWLRFHNWSSEIIIGLTHSEDRRLSSEKFPYKDSIYFLPFCKSKNTCYKLLCFWVIKFFLRTIKMATHRYIVALFTPRESFSRGVNKATMQCTSHMNDFINTKSMQERNLCSQGDIFLNQLSHWHLKVLIDDWYPL